MKKYWLTLYPHTFIWYDERGGLLYNSVRGNSREFAPDPLTEKAYRELCDLDNLYTCEIDEPDGDGHPAFKAWTETVVSQGFGQLTERTEGVPRPVSYFPQPRVMHDLERIRWEKENAVGGKIIDYLHEIVLHLNGSNRARGYHRQGLFPLPNAGTLDTETVAGLLTAWMAQHVGTVHLLGDPHAYPGLDRLAVLLDSCPADKVFHLVAEDLEENAEAVRLLQGHGIRTDIVCEDAARIPAPKAAWGETSYTVAVTDEDECLRAERFSERHPGIPVEAVPVYTGDNLPFFRKHVFLDREDLAEPGLSKREVFAHQLLNTHFFGKLYVTPDKKVYANLNRPPLGTTDDTVYDLLYREITEGSSWMLTRSEGACRSCPYRWLCPSPSNYELVIGRPDLCHLSDRFRT